MNLQYFKKVDFLFLLINNGLNLEVSAMKFAIKCPPFYRGLITSTGFGSRSFLVLGRKEAIL
jgi:hypothetical protein